MFLLLLEHIFTFGWCFWFSKQVYQEIDQRINSPGSRGVQAVLVLLSLQQVPIINPNIVISQAQRIVKTVQCELVFH